MDQPLARRIRSGVAATLAAGLIVLALTGSAMAGNNGTLKIHEVGTPTGTMNNDPKVCAFDVEAFGLDAGQSGYLVFTVQGGDAPQGTDAGPFGFGPADADGYAIAGPFGLEAGHYKATLYGKADLTDVKAKSKVFKVTCDDGGGGGGGGGGVG